VLLGRRIFCVYKDLGKNTRPEGARGPNGPTWRHLILPLHHGAPLQPGDLLVAHFGLLDAYKNL
jgi:hypothetical protein